MEQMGNTPDKSSQHGQLNNTTNNTSSIKNPMSLLSELIDSDKRFDVREMGWNKTSDIVYEHCNKFFGDCEKIEEYLLGDEKFYLMHYKLPIDGGEVLVTNGFAELFKEQSYENGGSGRGFEVVAVVDNENDIDEYAYLLMTCLISLTDDGVNLEHGVVIEDVSGITPDFCRKYNKTSLYFSSTEIMLGLYDIEHDLDNFSLFTAIPLHRNECEFLKEVGYDQFDELLELSEDDIFDFNRGSMLNP